MSEGICDASYCEGPDPNSGQPLWNSWPKYQWEPFLLECISFQRSVSLDQCSMQGCLLPKLHNLESCCLWKKTQTKIIHTNFFSIKEHKIHNVFVFIVRFSEYTMIISRINEISFLCGRCVVTVRWEMDLFNNISINTVFQWDRKYPSQTSTKKFVQNSTPDLQRFASSLCETVTC
jgi:hypothetical protein